MEVLIIVTSVIVCIVFYVVYTRTVFRKKRAARIAAAFGLPPENTDYELDSIRKYSRFFGESPLRVDEITWNDLDMDAVFKRINKCNSSIGEEYLYETLHGLPLETVPTQKREEVIRYFSDNPDERLKVQCIFAGLGKRNYNGVAGLIMNSEYILLPRNALYRIMALAPILFALFLIVNPTVGISGLVLTFVANLLIHYRSEAKISLEIQTIGYFTSMMNCCSKLLKIRGMEGLEPVGELKKCYTKLKAATRWAPIQKSNSGDVSEALYTYFDILFLISIRGYNTFMSEIVRENDAFLSLYRNLGELDASISVLSFRKSLPECCIPCFHASSSIIFDRVYHPLLNDPVVNSGAMTNDSLITGSNASGKSTFIKALAINGILAQTINTCAARTFTSRLSIIATSMVMRDDLLGGDSYFVVEIKSLKRILDLVGKYPCTCYVDEILRGTNTIERIAASASVLEHLYSRDCLCVAASHDIELTRILPHDNYHFSEGITDNEILFDYTLKPGPTTTRNALKLLKFTGFDETVVEAAEKLAECYEDTKAWAI